LAIDSWLRKGLIVSIVLTSTTDMRGMGCERGENAMNVDLLTTNEASRVFDDSTTQCLLELRSEDQKN
jgi:hypothetical protein